MSKKRMPKRPLGAGRFTLFTLAALLLGSGVLRGISGAGAAVATEFADVLDNTSELVEQCAPEPGLEQALSVVLRREETLAKREMALQDRIRALDVSEAALAKNMQALVEAENKLRATIALAETAADDDLARLTAVYENMKPKEAAALFEQMDPDFAAGFIGRMRPDAAASLLAGLDPGMAYSISVLLAGRNALVPRE